MIKITNNKITNNINSAEKDLNLINLIEHIYECIFSSEKREFFYNKEFSYINYFIKKASKDNDIYYINLINKLYNKQRRLLKENKINIKNLFPTSIFKLKYSKNLNNLTKFEIYNNLKNKNINVEDETILNINNIDNIEYNHFNNLYKTKDDRLIFLNINDIRNINKKSIDLFKETYYSKIDKYDFIYLLSKFDYIIKDTKTGNEYLFQNNIDSYIKFDKKKDFLFFYHKNVKYVVNSIADKSGNFILNYLEKILHFISPIINNFKYEENYSSFLSLEKLDSSDKYTNIFYLFNNDFMLDGEYLLISYEIETAKFFDNIIINNKYRVIIDEFNNSEKIISLLYISAFILVEDLITNKHLFLFNPFYYEVNKYFVKYYSSFTTV